MNCLNYIRRHQWEGFSVCIDECVSPWGSQMLFKNANQSLMRNQRRALEEQEAVQRWKSLQGLQHESPLGPAQILSQWLHCILNYFIVCICLRLKKHDLSLSLILPCVSRPYLYVNQCLHNFPLVYLMSATLSLSYFVSSWPIIILFFLVSCLICVFSSHRAGRGIPGRAG